MCRDLVQNIEETNERVKRMKETFEPKAVNYLDELADMV